MSDTPSAATQQSTLTDDELDEETGVPQSPSMLREQLRDERHPDWIRGDDEFDHVRPKSLYTPPLLTGQYGWRKWHGARDCGAQTVYYTERPLSDSQSPDHFSWTLRCGRCGEVKPDEVVFVNESWYYSLMDEYMVEWPQSKPFGSLWLDPDFVVETGGLPSDEGLTDLIRRSIYESEAQQRMAPEMPWEKGNE